MNSITTTVNDIRELFKRMKINEEFVVDKTGCKMLEIIGATFLADEETIFGAVNHDYVKREIQWYESMHRNVNYIPGVTPKAWLSCASPTGRINSNYGWMIWSDENYKQYENVLAELKAKPESRRAVMIYTRPNMWIDYNSDGMSDFVCTNAVQYFIRDGKLLALVQMRSNDAWAGYRNDVAWQKNVHERLANDLSIEAGQMIWHAGSIHLYERNFYLVDGYIKTGRYDLTLDECKIFSKNSD
jgi:thymidylate synthase